VVSVVKKKAERTGGIQEGGWKIEEGGNTEGPPALRCRCDRCAAAVKKKE